MPKNSSSPNIRRSVGMGILLSMCFFYAIHVLGEWKLENYQPDPETTSSRVLYNQCSIIGTEHSLNPGNDTSTNLNGLTGIKFAASFMNFFDGHILQMIIAAILFSAGIFLLSGKKNTNQS